MQTVPSFEELKNYYNKPNRKCGKTIGYVYLPKKTQTQQFIPPPKYEKINTLSNNKKEDQSYFQEYHITQPQYGMITETKEAQLLPMRCNNITCARCRPSIIKQYYLNTLNVILQDDINYHLIITFPGKQLREKVPWYQSYAIMNKDFVKLIQAINYQIQKQRQGKITHLKETLFPDQYQEQTKELLKEDLKYIKMPRSQNNPTKLNLPGYAHFHIGLNKPLNIKSIEEIIKKNKYKMGYGFITKNLRFADYVFNDFSNAAEWVIPLNLKHYSTSRNIILNKSQGYILPQDAKTYLYERNTTDQLFNIIEKDLRENKQIYKIFEKTILTPSPQHVPMEAMIQQWRRKT